MLILLAAALTLSVDLSDAPRRLIHSQMTMPVKAGTVSLLYPKWIPGEHGPTGPVVDVAGLVIRAGGKPVAWRRDPAEMYRILVDVPQGVSQLDIYLDYASPPPGNGQFTSGASITQNLAIFNWHTALLYPEGPRASDLRVKPSFKLPQGWRAATALPRDTEVSLETLIDSPVLAGAHLADIPLGENRGAPVTLHIAAETDEELQLSPEHLGYLKSLVQQEAALFGARHFNAYHFLLALTDAVPANGIEHHESSDNRLGGRTLLDNDLAKSSLVHLLAHESTHSWNGKYRRPAGLATPDYEQPMKGELLWVYEGLTQYLGTVLTARSGQWDAQTLRDYFAITADEQRSRTGRRWRPLQDTATAAQILYWSRDDWNSLRRSVDFYPEGDLVWLEVDTRLREAGSSMDEFVKRFHGGQDTPPRVVTYTFDDVVQGLDQLAPKAGLRDLLRARLDQTGDDAPLEGLARAGWKLDYSDTPSELQKARDKDLKRIDLRSSIGVIVDLERETIADVIGGRPADRAGVMPGSKLIAVNGRKFSTDRLLSAVAAKKRVELLVQNADTFKSFLVDYEGGLRFPRLVRIEGRPDLLSAIAAPRK